MRGFSLVEILIVMSLMGMLAGISLPVYKVYQTRNNLDTATAVTVEAVRRAQIKSQTMIEDDSWGVHLSSGEIRVYRGVDFVGRDQSFDEIFDIPENIIITGDNEIVFEKLSGNPVSVGTIILSYSSRVKNIFVNEKGTVIY